MRTNDREDAIATYELCRLVADTESKIPVKDKRQEMLNLTKNPVYWISSFSGVPRELYGHKETFNDKVLAKATVLAEEVVETRANLAEKLDLDEGEVDILAFDFQQGNVQLNPEATDALKDYIRTQAKLYNIASSPSNYKEN